MTEKKNETPTPRAAKKFQVRRATPQDPYDGHTHEAYFDEDGHGATTVDGTPPHNHMIYGFKVQDAFAFDREKEEGFQSCHPGSLAFAEMESIDEMEIFREGTHNGDTYSAEDLEKIVSNFHALKTEVRPKLKITHRENQKTLAGLASYGDIVDVFTKTDSDGKKRLCARIMNVPKQVIEFIKNRRFPERSVEIYPYFRLGTKDDSPVYENVLKAIALLGHEMPAVTGMAPVMLSEVAEAQKTVCIGEVCFPCAEAAAGHAALYALDAAATVFKVQNNLER